MNKLWKHDYFRSLILASISILLFVSASATLFSSPSWYENENKSCIQCGYIAFAQNNVNSGNANLNNVSQMWVDKTSGIGINFAYSPAKPVVDSPTELRFIVHDLKSGIKLKDLVAHVSITSNSSGQERTFKFSNITAPNGDFLLKYIFPDYGTYQVIASVRPNASAVALASFPITIRVPTASTFTSPAMPVGIVIIIVGIVALTVVIIKIKK
jgi:hypothetical protein